MMSEAPTILESEPPAGSTVRPGPAASDLHLNAGQRAALAAWISAGYPYETCGLLLGRTEDRAIIVDRVVQARNLNQERADDRYELAPEDFLAADAEARRDGIEIVGIWHSHPDCPARPSHTDLKAAWEGYSYLIIGITGDGDTAFHSWRLAEGLFAEEKILPQPPSPTAVALRFDQPLKEEQSS